MGGEKGVPTMNTWTKFDLVSPPSHISTVDV